jgi:hypothetical protein
MSDSTNILDLPTDPVAGGSISNNVSISAQEIHTQQQQSQPGMTQSVGASGMTLDQTTITQIVNGLQQASMTGATQLPSRDIPMTTNSLSSDPQIMPNYVPPPHPQHTDYIKNYEQSSDMVNDYNKKNQMNSSLDEMYNEIQMPLLVAVLFFLFQLPFFKKFLYSYLPVLFSNDGNYNINGYLFTSLLFGLIFHFLLKMTGMFSVF